MGHPTVENSTLDLTPDGGSRTEVRQSARSWSAGTPEKTATLRHETPRVPPDPAVDEALRMHVVRLEWRLMRPKFVDVRTP